MNIIFKTFHSMNFRCESQDELEQLNKSTSQNSFEKNNLYPWKFKKGIIVFGLDLLAS